MSLPRSRKLTLFDAMFLVAAAGVGLAVFRLVLRTLLGAWFRWENLIAEPPGGWTGGKVLVRMVEWVAPSLPLAAAWTFAVPVLRLKPPRPSGRRLARQPGTTACLAAILGAGWAAA